MENVFQEIRNRIGMPEAAKFYGLQINRNGMARCPFHEDKKPSLKIYSDHYYCFGCGATGDAVGFVAKLFGVRQLDAARKLSYDFGLGVFDGEIAVPVQLTPTPEREFRLWLEKAEQAVVAYLDKLYQWRVRYRPQNMGEQLNPLFAESLTKTEYTEYLYEILCHGSEQEKLDLFRNNRDSIERIQNRLMEIAARERIVKRKAI